MKRVFWEMLCILFIVCRGDVLWSDSACSVAITLNQCPGVTINVTPTVTAQVAEPIFSPAPPSPVEQPVAQTPEAPAPVTIPTRQLRLMEPELVREGWLTRLRGFVDAHAPEVRIFVYEKAESVRGYVVRHWLELLGKGLAVCYVSLNYYMFRLTNYLRSSERWFYWRQELSLGKLLAIPRDELLRELVACCNTRKRTTHPPLLTIFTELEQEQEHLERYRSWVSSIYAFDDMQHHCVRVCEYVIPSWLSFPATWALRLAAHYLGARQLVYSNDELTKISTEALAKVTYLKQVVSEALLIYDGNVVSSLEEA